MTELAEVALVAADPSRPVGLDPPLSVQYVHALDGVRLALTVLRPKTTPRACVLIIHGFSQNRKAFLLGKVPSSLLEVGLLVVVGELRGHGLSERPKTWSIEDHLRLDLPRLAEETARIAQEARVHLVGHSMGGMLGYAALAGPHLFASVTTIATPLDLGRGSPLVGVAARAVRPVVRLKRDGSLPVDRLLRLLSGPLSRRGGPRWVRAAQRVLGLGNPEEAEPQILREVLASSDPEPIRVFEHFLTYALAREGRFAGVDVMEAIRASACPIAAIVGGRDIFAPPPSVAMLTRPGHRGPRRLVVVRRGAHVDLTVGDEVARAVRRLVPFWEVP